MRAVDIPGIGRGVVLPPEGTWAETADGTRYLVGSTGDTVDVEEECPTCEGDGAMLCTNPACACLRCVPCPDCSTGTVSVPRVVTEVLPMFAASHPYGNGAPHLYLRRGEWRRCDGRGVGSTHVGAIPGAQPGGVVLVVERKP